MQITVTCTKEEAILNLPEQFLLNLEITTLALRTLVPGQRPDMQGTFHRWLP
jgi:hypothetical protein